MPLFNSPRTLLPVAAIVLTCQAAGAAIVLGNGDTVNLGALLASGSDRTVIINDKMFRFESFASSQMQASSFTIVGFVSANQNQYGLNNVGFDLVGPFGDGSPGDGEVHEMNLQYEVSVLPSYYAQGVRLCDARLTFNGSAGADGSYARVDETVFDLDTNTFLGNMSVYDIFGPPRQLQYVDMEDYCELYGTPGYRAFEVNKDLKFFAATANDFSTASFVRQEFSQIPGPGAAALAAMACTLVRRRRA